MNAMKEIIELALSGFWKFIGFTTILYIVCHFTFLIMNRFFRIINVMIKGWPPAHLDADGDSVEMIKSKYENMNL